jgi:hypothetical protein
VDILFFEDVQDLDSEIAGAIVEGEVDCARREWVAGIVALRPVPTVPKRSCRGSGWTGWQSCRLTGTLKN